MSTKVRGDQLQDGLMLDQHFVDESISKSRIIGLVDDLDTIVNDITIIQQGDTVLRADLASSQNGKGASIVGIEDSAGDFINAGNVEEALHELKLDIADKAYITGSQANVFNVATTTSLHAAVSNERLSQALSGLGGIGVGTGSTSILTLKYMTDDFTSSVINGGLGLTVVNPINMWTGPTEEFWFIACDKDTKFDFSTMEITANSTVHNPSQYTDPPAIPFSPDCPNELIHYKGLQIVTVDSVDYNVIDYELMYSVGLGTVLFSEQYPGIIIYLKTAGWTEQTSIDPPVFVRHHPVWGIKTLYHKPISQAYTPDVGATYATFTVNETALIIPNSVKVFINGVRVALADLTFTPSTKLVSFPKGLYEVGDEVVVDYVAV